MQYMGGKSRIAQSIADIISMTGGGRNMRYQGGKSRIAQDIASVISVRGGIALSAFSAAVAPLKAKCRAFPARSSMTATNTSLHCFKVCSAAMSCQNPSRLNNTDISENTKTMILH